MPGMGAPIGGGLAEDAEERQRVAAVKQAFEQRASGLTSEWRSADDSGPTAIGMIGRAYDLIVMPQPGALPKMPESVFETALFDSGRPVLVVPQGFTRHGRQAHPVRVERLDRKRACDLARHAGAEPRRGDRRAERRRRHGAGADARRRSPTRCAAHGLNVTSQHVKPGTRSAGQTIVDTAIAGGADLIVKGAYTQSRLRQMIFGGMTRHLILNSPLPVLFSY